MTSYIELCQYKKACDIGLLGCNFANSFGKSIQNQQSLNQTFLNHINWLNQPLDESLESLKQAVSQPLFEGIEWIIVSLGDKGEIPANNYISQ